MNAVRQFGMYPQYEPSQSSVSSFPYVTTPLSAAHIIQLHLFLEWARKVTTNNSKAGSDLGGLLSYVHLLNTIESILLVMVMQQQILNFTC